MAVFDPCFSKVSWRVFFFTSYLLIELQAPLLITRIKLGLLVTVFYPNLSRTSLEEHEKNISNKEPMVNF